MPLTDLEKMAEAYNHWKDVADMYFAEIEKQKAFNEAAMLRIDVLKTEIDALMEKADAD